MSRDIPADVRAFIKDHVRSIVQLELLLLLSRDPSSRFSAEQVARDLCIALDAANSFLEAMRASSMIAVDDEWKYHFEPQNPEWVSLVSALGHLYRERRLSVIECIYSRDADRLQSFADAFRLRKDK